MQGSFASYAQPSPQNTETLGATSGARGLCLVAAGLAVVGVIENVNIRAGEKYKPRPRS